MKTYKKYDLFVLNKLIDMYESSVLFTGRNKQTVNIDFSFTQKSIPEYFDESHPEFEKIHIMLNELESKKYIQIIWKNNKKSSIILKARLNLNELDTVYSFLNRKPKSKIVSEAIEYIENKAKHSCSNVCVCFSDYIVEKLKENKSVKEFVDISDIEDIKNVFTCIESIELNKDAVYCREFSIKVFHDSKVFESLIKRIHKIFNLFGDNTSEDEAEWLSDYNIYKNPSFVYMKGPVSFTIGENFINLSCLQQGIGVSVDDIDNIKFIQKLSNDKIPLIGSGLQSSDDVIPESKNQIKNIITIENLTSYCRWNKQDSIIVYLGGYHNAVVRNLLEKLYNSFPDANFLHFGDIDAGGFDIYRDLCKKTKIPFSMYNMNLETLKSHENYCKPLTKNDIKRLQQMLEHHVCTDELKELIEYMLLNNIKLEQECILPD